MADLSDLRTAVRETAARAEPPAFDLLARRATARRRRRRATTAVAGLAAAAVAGAIVVGPVRHETRGPVPPATRTTHTAMPAPRTSLAERIVTDPRAGVLDLALSGNDPDVRALTKGGALGLSGADTQWATAVTTDGFRTSRFVDVGGPGADIVPLAGDRFFVGPGSAAGVGRAWVVRTDGSRTPVRFQHDTHPAADGEVLVSCGDWQYCALDPDTATAHWFPGPTPTAGRDPGLGNGQFTLWQDGRTIWGYSGNREESPAQPEVYWSHDGGAHWAQRPVRGVGPGVRLTMSAGFTRPDLAFAYGTGHGPSYSPQERLHFRTLLRGREGGTSWEKVRFPGGDVTDGVVLPGGQAVLVTADGRLYRSTDDSWTRWTDLTAGWPATHGDEEHLAVSGAGALYSTRIGYGRAKGSIWQSLDGGSTWQPARQPGS